MRSSGPPKLIALAVGSRLGHYDVTALIGEGGMGEVYRARDTKLYRDDLRRTDVACGVCDSGSRPGHWRSLSADAASFHSLLGDIPQRRVQPVGIVEAFDVLRHGLVGHAGE